MSGQTEYQGSQAYTQKTNADEFVSPNSGSVGFSKTLVNLRGVTKFIGLSVKMTYTSGAHGSYGLPKNWDLDIPFTIPNSSLTSQGKTYIVNPDWSDITSYHSGLKYVNSHAMKFENIFPALPLPSGRAGYYAWRLRLIDGAMEYFDTYGKLLEHADIYGNSIYYAYVDPMAGPLQAKLDYILDSWGQKIQFKYDFDAGMTVVLPDGAQQTAVFGTQGVDSIEDAVGYKTSFTYETFGTNITLDSITFPTGLRSTFEYFQIPALDQNGESFTIPACSQHGHQDSTGKILDVTEYAYGQATGFAYYTGASIGCKMSGSSDSLMESNNQDYRYDVIIRRLDASGKTLQISQVWYNYLHLAMQEEQNYVDANGNPSPACRTTNIYNIAIDQHARAPTYNLPCQTDHFHYGQSSYEPLRRATSTYDDFGCPTETTESIWDQIKQSYIPQKNVISTYITTSWGGEMLSTETYVDNISGYEKQIAYKLTSDQRSIEESTVSYRTGASSTWMPWKIKSYSYDSAGRITMEAVSWSPGTNPPPGSVSQFSYGKAYTFDAAAGTVTESTTDAMGKISHTSHQVKTTGGPLIKKVSPLGSTETMTYDPSGRLVETTDALGFTSKKSYLISSAANRVQSVNSIGYIVEQSYDALGRVIEVKDSGNTTTGSVARSLSRNEYDSMSRVVKSTDQLGLTKTQSYDTLGRVIETMDVDGNIITRVYNDIELSVEEMLNGDLRSKSFMDSAARIVKVVSYADSAATSPGYSIATETAYDGFSKVMSAKQWQQPLDGSPSIMLSYSETIYNVEDKAQKILKRGLSSNLKDPLDQVQREFTFDIFGNSTTYKKTVKYGDGRQYVCDGPISVFDACNRLVELKNQLGQSEINGFDDDGRLVSMTRYDGTNFTYSYDLLGQMLSSNGPDGLTVYTYLPNGRLASTAKGGATITNEYAPDGSIMKTTYPDGLAQIYTLDEYSRVISETDAAKNTTQNSFDSQGRLDTKTMGTNKIEYEFGNMNHCNGILIGAKVSGAEPYYRSIAYDAFGRQSQVTDRNPQGTLLLNTIYLRDSRSLLLSRDISSGKYTDASINNTLNFEYDGLAQLVSISSSSNSGVPESQTQTTYTYDGNYNVLGKTENNISKQFAYNVVDQRTDVGFTYDTNGRLTADPSGQTYQYDAEDRLVAVGGSAPKTYSYYPNDALASSSASGNDTAFYYSCGAVNSTLQSSQSGSSWTSYLLQPGGPLAADQEGQGSTQFFESQNSFVLAVGASEALSYGYSAYGEQESSTSTKGFLFGWQRELNDADNGLTYLRSRYYRAENMAFLTMDSSRSQENRYAYGAGDPINTSDGTGHSALRLATLAGTLTGLATTLASGGLLWLVGIKFAATSLTTLGVTVAAVSGAAGSISGDAASVAIMHQSLTWERAGEDLLVGAVGGAVGAGCGGLASAAAMRMASASEAFEAESITRIGIGTSSVIGGGAGGFSSAVTSAALHHQNLLSADTGLAVLIGLGSGAGGAMVGGGTVLGFSKLVSLPVPLTRSELHLIVPAATIDDGDDLNSTNVFIASVPREQNGGITIDAAQLLQTVANGPQHIAIIADGDAGRMYATARYRGGIVRRPIDATLLAGHIRSATEFGNLNVGNNFSGQIKLISSHGGWGNAQKVADVMQMPVWGAYGSVAVDGTPKWHLFRPA